MRNRVVKTGVATLDELPTGCRPVSIREDRAASSKNQNQEISVSTNITNIAPDKITIPVHADGHDYDVQITRMESLGGHVRAMSDSPLVVVITNPQLVAHVASPAIESLKAAGFRVVVATLEPGEANKSLASVGSLFDQIFPHRPERSTVVVAIGGGIVTDVAGFVAATMLRGVRLVSVPTTLLAMVDSSVGGKTGVNHSTGKNLIGSFHQPGMVLIDVRTLRTLPAREISAGLAECVKHDLIRDAEHFSKLLPILSAVQVQSADVLEEFIAHNVRIKAKVVEEDPTEEGVRAHLNLGHTFGHAYETVSNYAMLHGECVSLGIISSAHVSRELGLISSDEASQMSRTLRACMLPTSGMAFDVDRVMEVMRNDKKVRQGKIRLVLLDGIGKAVVRDDVSDSLVRSAIESIR